MTDNVVFDKIAEKLNTDFKEGTPKEIVEISTDIQEFEDKKKELVKSVENKTLEDKDYLQTEIKNVIGCGKDVLEKLKDEIKIGSSARIYEVYAALMNSVIIGLKELRELNKTTFDIETINDDLGKIPDKGANISIVMDAREVLKYINEAKEKNELDAVEANFKIEETKREKDECDSNDSTK